MAEAKEEVCGLEAMNLGSIQLLELHGCPTVHDGFGWTPIACWISDAVTPFRAIPPSKRLLKVLLPPVSWNGAPLVYWTIVPSVHPPTTRFSRGLSLRNG